MYSLGSIGISKELKSSSFSGGPWQEAKSEHAWKEKHLDTKEKFMLIKLLQLLLDWSFLLAAGKDHQCSRYPWA